MIERHHEQRVVLCQQLEEKTFNGGARVLDTLAVHAVADVEQKAQSDRHAIVSKLVIVCGSPSSQMVKASAGRSDQAAIPVATVTVTTVRLRRTKRSSGPLNWWRLRGERRHTDCRRDHGQRGEAAGRRTPRQYSARPDRRRLRAGAVLSGPKLRIRGLCYFGGNPLPESHGRMSLCQRQLTPFVDCWAILLIGLTGTTIELLLLGTTQAVNSFHWR